MTNATRTDRSIGPTGGTIFRIGATLVLRSRCVVLCAGPQTDELLAEVEDGVKRDRPEPGEAAPRARLLRRRHFFYSLLSALLPSMDDPPRQVSHHGLPL